MNLLILLLILAGIIVIAKMLSKIMKIMDVLLYLIVGFVCVKFGILNPTDELLFQLAELGVLFLMFAAGWNEDLLVFLRKIWENKWIAIIAAIGPFVGAFLAMKLLGFTQTEAIVAGFIFIATAVPFTVMILNSLNLHKTPGAKAILSSAIADDFISIFSMSVVFSLFALFQGASIELTSTQILLSGLKNLALIIIAFITFIIFGLLIFPEERVSKQQGKGIKRFIQLVKNISSIPGLKAIHKFFYLTRITIPLTLLILFALAAFSQFMGLHAAIGAYLVGLILHEKFYFVRNKDEGEEPIIERNHQNLSSFVHQVANDWLGPVFFIYLGTQLVISPDNAFRMIGLSFVLFLFLLITQFTSAMFSARLTTNLAWKDSILVGFGMLPRDILAFVVMGTAIQFGLIDGQSLFVTIIVIAVLMLNIFTPFAMSWWEKYYREEKTLRIFKIDLSK